ncbi:GWxTD domain-containing protein [candidate division KSB1 bacterium]|nr:GWxTD domain-containing protein [candidate division KSB1 bacterium]
MWLSKSHHPFYRSANFLKRKKSSHESRVPCGRCTELKPHRFQLFLLALGALGLGVFTNAPETAFAQAVPTYERQPAVFDFDQTAGLPPYIFRAYQFAAETRGHFRVEVYIGMVNDILQFVKASSDSDDAGGYRAQYEINVTIWDKKNNLVDSHNWKRELVASSFDATNDRKKFNLERAAFDLPPGEYEIALEITDRDTGKNLRERRPLKLAESDGQQLRFSSVVFTEPFGVRHLLDEANPAPTAAEALAAWKSLPRPARRDSLRYNLTAILTNYARAGNGQPDGVSQSSAGSQSADPHGAIAAGAYFEIYGAAAGETLQLQYEIRDWRQQIEQAWEETLTVTEAPLSHLAVLAEKITQPGLHTFRLVAKSASTKEATAEESFQVQVSASLNYAAPLAENSVLLYEPLRYIVKGAEYKRIAEADAAARDSLLAEFWRQRDPDPVTPANQLREEFYRRVAFSDMRFAAAGKSGAKTPAGWETDRGRIYIKYGPPKEVHHQMAEQGSPPYEIWFYPNLDLYFVFRDKTGSGDYELVNR